MVNVLGDKVSVTFPDTEDDVYLFLDVTGQDWSQVRGKNPALTYIVTTKPLTECQDYIALGYFNILPNTIPKLITKNSLLNFMNTRYEDNRIKLVVDNLLPLYKQYGTTVGCIAELLQSIKSCNLETYRKLVKYNINPMVGVLDQLKMMVTLAEAMQGNATTIQAMQAEIADARVKSAEYSLLQQKFAELTTEREDLRHSLTMLKSEYNELKEKVAQDTASSIMTTSVNVSESPEYLALKKQLEQANLKLTELSAEYSRLQITAGIVTNDSGTEEDPKDRLITNLKKEIETLRSTSYVDMLRQRIPSVTQALALKADCILYLKEIKPQIYINSLIQWLEVLLRVRYRDLYHKTYLILVFDQLSNEYTIKKYDKRKWAINTTPNATASVVVTNEVSLGFLKDRLQIDQYDFLVVIDRLGNLRDVFDTPKTQKFYLVNTVNDVTDFNLDRNRCIGFFDQDADQFVKYHMSPTDATGGLTTSDFEKRAYKIYKDHVFDKILIEIGVMPNT